MKRILLSIFAVAAFSANAQDAINATGFNEDFTASGPTTDGTRSIYWWGKEAVGQNADCDAMIPADKTKCEAFGCSRTRSGNGILQLSVTQGKDGWSPIGFSIENSTDVTKGVDVSTGVAGNKVEISMKNEGTNNIEVYFTFTSNNDKTKTASGGDDASKFGGVVAAGATYTTSYDLGANARKVAWVGAGTPAATTCVTNGGTMVGDNCVTNTGFSATALTGVEFSINGAGASVGGVWQQPAITANPVAVYYIRGGSSPVSVSELSSTKFNVYPSPASGLVNVNFEAKENTTVAITDITGRILISERVATGSHSLQYNVSSFSEGMYFVTFTGLSGQHTEKVLVK